MWCCQPCRIITYCNEANKLLKALCQQFFKTWKQLLAYTEPSHRCTNLNEAAIIAATRSSVIKSWKAQKFVYADRINMWGDTTLRSGGLGDIASLVIVKDKAIQLQAFRAPGGWGSQILRQSAHKGGKVVSPTRRPSLPPGNIHCTHFC
jgi:hypothetical protein